MIEKFYLKQIVGRGSYGTVFKAIEKGTNTCVAVKRISKDVDDDFNAKCLAQSFFREINAIKQLQNHDNIIKSLNAFEECDCFYICLEWMKQNLSDYIYNYKILNQFIDTSIIKNIMLQIVSGIKHIHSNGFIHRDIKPGNILLDHNNVVKIADFGLSRNFDRCMTLNVQTLYYRAPEIILQNENYNLDIDIWSVGLIFIELFHLSPFICEEDDTMQLIGIFKSFGTPNRNYLPDGYKTIPQWNRNIKFKNMDKMCPDGWDLLSNMTKYFNRISANDALKHPYFLN